MLTFELEECKMMLEKWLKGAQISFEYSLRRDNNPEEQANIRRKIRVYENLISLVEKEMAQK